MRHRLLLRRDRLPALSKLAQRLSFSAVMLVVMAGSFHGLIAGQSFGEIGQSASNRLIPHASIAFAGELSRIKGAAAHPLPIPAFAVEAPQTTTWINTLKILIAIVLVLMVVASLMSRLPKRRASRPIEPAPRVKGKPAGPRRIHYLIAAVGFTLFAIYGSLVPLHYRELSFADALVRFRQIPFLQLSIEYRADWVANILLFIPISYCWLAGLLVDRPQKSWRLLWLLPVLGGCCLLSVAIEFTQIWFPPRTVSQNDIVAECLGGLVGAIVWLVCGQRVTDWIRGYTNQVRPGTQFDWLLQAYLAGLIIYSLAPFDLTIHPVEIYRQFREGKIVLIPYWTSDFGSTGLWNRLTDVAIFIPVGCLATKLFVPRPYRLRSLGESILVGTAIVAAIELAQILVYTRFSSTTDVITGAVGVAMGAYFMRRWESVSASASAVAAPSAYTMVGWAACTVCYGVFLCCVFWWPFDVTSDSAVIAERLDGYLRAPLSSLYWGSEYHALTEFLRKTLLFLPLGMLAAQTVVVVTSRQSTRKLLYAFACLVCLLLAFGVELVQAIIPSHVCDVTDTMLYGLGAVAGLVIRARLASGKAIQVDSSKPGQPPHGKPDFVLVSRSPSTDGRSD